MATFGQGINPQLGAIDYSAYSRGALQGSAAIGQGIKSLGQDLAQGIQQYQQNKLMAGQATAEFEAAVSQSPKLLSTISSPNAPPEVAKALKKLQKDGAVGLKDAAVLSTYAKTFIMGEKRQKEAEMDMEKLKNDQIQAQAQMMNAQANMLSARRPASGAQSDKDTLFNTQVQGFIEQNQRQPNAQEVAAIAKAAYAPTRMYASPEEQARVEELKAESNSAVKFLDSVTQQAMDVEGYKATNAEARRLIESVDSGFGQEWLTQAQALAQRLGVGDPTKLANQQVAEAFIATDALTQTQLLMSKQGSITENERKLVDRTAMKIGKTKEANLEILNLRDAFANRAQAAELERQRLFDEGKSSKETAEGLKRWYAKNSISSFLDAVSDPTGDKARAREILAQRRASRGK